MRHFSDLQRQAGATALLTPTGWVDEADPDASVKQTFDWVRATRDAGPTEPLFVSLALTRSWLTNKRLRDMLLDQIVDSNERYWYIRVRWEVLPTSHGQLVDEDLLRGYKALCQTASSEHKIVVLANSSLVGWMATAWGARGFTTGTGGPEYSFGAIRKIASRKGVPKPPAKRRYYERQLMHIIEVDTHTSVSRAAGYVDCTCAYCAALDFKDPTAWDRDAARRHIVVSLGRELSQTARESDYFASVEASIGQAQAFAASLPTRLRQEERPNHLDIWGRLLR